MLLKKAVKWEKTFEVKNWALVLSNRQTGFMWHVLRIDTEDAKQNVSRNYRNADSGYAIGTPIGTPAYDIIAESP